MTDLAAKLPEGTEKVYIRVDQNKLYWVGKDGETGDVDTVYKTRETVDVIVDYQAISKTAYDSVHEFDDDPDYFQNALGIAREIPSAETIRQRIRLMRVEQYNLPYVQ